VTSHIPADSSKKETAPLVATVHSTTLLLLVSPLQCGELQFRKRPDEFVTLDPPENYRLTPVQRAAVDGRHGSAGLAATRQSVRDTNRFHPTAPDMA
jgi:hypothetical protein